MGKLRHQCNQTVILTPIKLDFRPEARVSTGALDEDPRIHATMELGCPARCQMTWQFLDIMEAARLPAWDAATGAQPETDQTSSSANLPNLPSADLHANEALPSREAGGHHVCAPMQNSDTRSRSTQPAASLTQDEFREDTHFSEPTRSRMKESHSPHIDVDNRENQAELTEVLRGLHEYRDSIACRTQAPFHADIEALRIRVSSHRET